MKDIEKITLRIPERIHSRLVAYQRQKPHMSLNALIVEAISKDLDRQEQEAARDRSHAS